MRRLHPDTIDKSMRLAALLFAAILAFELSAHAQSPVPKGDKPVKASGNAARKGADSKAKGAKTPQTKTQAVTRQREGQGAEQEAGPMLQHPFPRKVKALSLDGGVGWLNTAGPLDIQDLRGKFVVLDFWTYCCINCMHVLPELKKLEKAYPNEVVVIGVHSAKFETEQDSKNIEEAILRYEIEHPVVNDANHAIWNRYGTRSWPTLIIIDPEGYAVFLNQGETQFEQLDEVIRIGLPYYKAKGVLDERPIRFELARYKADATPLRFPGKVLADEAGGRLFITDSNHNRIVIAKLDGTLIETIGSGAEGAADGDFAAATFNHPQGLFLHGQTLYVSDTENHMLRKVDLEKKQVTTIAGTGKQGQGWPGLEELRQSPFGDANLPDRWVGPPRTTKLNSPWALWVHGSDLYIAMAGPHQIWKMPLDESEIGPYAGSGREDIIDGPLLPKRPYEPGFSAFAQPSGLSSDGKVLYVADSEGSSIRAVPFDSRKEVRTIVGTAGMTNARLFTFGDVDGKGRKVRLQHPLEVVYHDGKVYVADTYNHKIKAIDVKAQTTTTLAGGNEDFDEPAGMALAGTKLYVADTNNHRIRTVDLANGNKVETLEIKGLSSPLKPSSTGNRPDLTAAAQSTVAAVTTKAADGAVEAKIELNLPEGYKINEAAPMYTYVEGAGSLLDPEAVGKLAKVEKPGKTLTVKLPLAQTEGSDEIKVFLSAYYCQEGAEGVCREQSVVWTIPLTVSSAAGQESVKLSYNVDE